LTGSPFMAIAALWREGKGNQPPSVTMPTTVPGPDVAPYHDRQVAVLQLRDWRAWMELTVPEAELLNPFPAGSLAVETVRPASD
jgi:putative SOS response-associated peptidase YedK